MNSQNKNSHTDKKNKLYTFVQKEGDDFTCLKLISKEYDGIIYKYGNVGFRPENEAVDGKLPMVFDYTVIENKLNADTDSQEFIDHIGDILVVLLDEQLKEKKELHGKN